MDLSRATASAICKSSSRFAATVPAILVSWFFTRGAGLRVFVDKLVGKNEFRVGDGVKWKLDVAVIRPDHDILAVQPQQGGAKAFAGFCLVALAFANALDGRVEFDLGFMARPAGEIHRPGQRAVNAG